MKEGGGGGKRRRQEEFVSTTEEDVSATRIRREMARSGTMVRLVRTVKEKTARTELSEARIFS